MLKMIKEVKNNPGLLPKLLVIIYRFGYIIHFKIKVPIIQPLMYFVYRLADLCIVKLLLNCDVLGSVKIGAGVKFYHPYGIIINDAAVIGKNARIRGQVTIGNKGENDLGCPTIGNNVEIGVGAKIIGNISLGNNIKIGANAVVTKSFPDNAILVGVPAHNVVKRKKTLE